MKFELSEAVFKFDVSEISIISIYGNKFLYFLFTKVSSLCLRACVVVSRIYNIYTVVDVRAAGAAMRLPLYPPPLL